MKARTCGNAECGCGMTSGLVQPPGDAAGTQGPGLAAFPLRDELPGGCVFLYRIRSFDLDGGFHS